MLTFTVKPHKALVSVTWLTSSS